MMVLSVLLLFDLVIVGVEVFIKELELVRHRMVSGLLYSDLPLA
eukprot:CAMPEP_0168347758 /NCGR_PEP_ID=MMETSP0213-20121227/19230_1 /TAXON_ID=151035 /ORGANISM="Euplotes harpa, Strain FSP1.4" /LENGTH=43 /DNA_ID= /DNA_START= /DNA_END= /DNA_ORIENTATION=